MALTEIQKVRLEIGDTDSVLPVLSDSEYAYFIEKNNNSISRSAMDAAKTILFKLSMRTREDIDIFSIHGQQAAQNYAQALKLYIKSPEMNPVLNNVRGYVGGVSKSDMEANVLNTDNNTVLTSFNSSYSPSGTFQL